MLNSSHETPSSPQQLIEHAVAEVVRPEYEPEGQSFKQYAENLALKGLEPGSQIDFPLPQQQPSALLAELLYSRYKRFMEVHTMEIGTGYSTLYISPLHPKNDFEVNKPENIRIRSKVRGVFYGGLFHIRTNAEQPYTLVEVYNINRLSKNPNYQILPLEFPEYITALAEQLQQHPTHVEISRGGLLESEPVKHIKPQPLWQVRFPNQP